MYLPKIIELETSRTCNLKCATCPRNRHPIGPLYLTPDTFSKVVDEISTVQKVYLIGGGEPLLNPYLNEILEIAQKKNIKIGIVTNGTLVTKDIIDRWKEFGIWQVAISLDSFEQELLDKLRPGASVTKVQGAVKSLIDSGIKVGLHTLRYKGNVSEWKSILDWCWSLGIGVTFINPIYNEDTEGDPVIGRPSSWLPSILKDKRGSWCTSQPYISLEGGIYTCPFIPLLANGNEIKEFFLGHRIETTLENFYMGNILGTSFPDVWNGKRYKDFRQGFKGMPKIIDKETFVEMRIQKPIKGTVQEYCASCTARWGVSCEA